MREKADMRDKRACKKRKRKELKKVSEKSKNFQHITDVGAVFIDLLKKYEYAAK